MFWQGRSEIGNKQYFFLGPSGRGVENKLFS